jgi:hypothetical protein
VADDLVIAALTVGAHADKMARLSRLSLNMDFMDQSPFENNSKNKIFLNAKMNSP